jgi:arylformamidase
MSERVFLDYTQAELDASYDQAAHAPNRDQILARMAKNSELVRTRLGEPLRLAYGASAIEQLDVYRASRPGAPVLVYVHGGAWRAGRARDYGYPAEAFVEAGAHYVALDFDNVLAAGGSLFVMVDQVRRAVAWVCRNAAEFGGDPARVYVAGASSGAHLAGVVATSGCPVKGYMLISGMYDLRAPRLSKRSDYVKFTDEMEHALSPQRHLARIGAPVALAYGSLETPDFKRQTREFAAALETAGKAVQVVCGEGYNHFEIAETIGNPYGPVGRAVLALMGLAPRSAG